MDPRRARTLVQAPVQWYETTIYNRDGGPPFSFITVPSRSMSDSEIPDIADVQRRLGLRDRPRPRMAGVIEPWALPFAIDIALGRDERSLYEPWGPFFLEEHLRGNRPGGPSPFAQYLAYAPLVPFESSPLSAKALSDLAAAGGGIGAAVGAYATGDPLVLLAVPAGIVVCGAAHGLAEALRIGLRARLLRLMGVDDPSTDQRESEPPSS